MALVLKDRVKETSTTTGTGTFTLAGASTGFQSFSSIGDGNTTYYAIALQGGSEWEVGIGTYTLSGTTLARTAILASSNSGSAVNFSAGTKEVFVTYPAGRSVIGGEGYTENDIEINVSSTINTGRNAMSAGPISVASGITVTVPTGSVWTVV
jgi:hypothetical protein